MYKTAAMGDKYSVAGFASLGITVFPVTQSSDAVKTLHSLAQSDYAVIFITEQLAGQMQSEIAAYDSKPLPAIIPIPGVRGNTGIGMANVSKFVEKAVGSDIIS